MSANRIPRSRTFYSFAVLWRSVADFGELGESGSEVFHDLLRNDIRIEQAGAVFEALVFEREDGQLVSIVSSDLFSLLAEPAASDLFEIKLAVLCGYHAFAKS